MKRDVRIEQFRTDVWRYWKEHGRHSLPWRTTKNPYRILVSEVMLQQTQVPRVLEKYVAFLKCFPTIESLAQAPLQEVLKVWSGMGYNRRAKFLKRAAEQIMHTYNGRVPRDVVHLRSLSGIGPYTASAILVFAYNIPDTLIETNIRAVFIHHFFPTQTVHDRDLLPLLAQAAEGQNPREWHWALMDYGSHLKKLHKNPARRSVHHTKQSTFEGSLRQVRGAIVRELTKGPKKEAQLEVLLGTMSERLQDALQSLVSENMILKSHGLWRIA